jgi:hypothetical protein
MVRAEPGPGDSAAYASALYHATHARVAHEARWEITGYATLGLVGVVIALGLIGSSRLGRSKTEGTA